MISKAYADMAFVAGRKFTLHGVDHAIGDPVDVTGVPFHRIRQMVASRHLRAIPKVEPVVPTVKPRAKRAA